VLKQLDGNGQTAEESAPLGELPGPNRIRIQTRRPTCHVHFEDGYSILQRQSVAIPRGMPVIAWQSQLHLKQSFHHSLRPVWIFALEQLE
jgi:hypothetical protein